MTDTSIRYGGPEQRNPGNTINGTAHAATPQGTPLYPLAADGTLAAAEGSSATLSKCVGLAQNAQAAGGPLAAQFSGPFAMTTAEWDLIAGTEGGLAPGTAYYLNSTTPGKITSVAPSAGGTFTCQVGIGLSATVMLIQIIGAGNKAN